MNRLLNYFYFMLEQNQSEKTLSLFGLIVMGIILFVFIIDSTARYKSDYVPKSRPIKVFTVLLFILVVIATIILLNIYLK